MRDAGDAATSSANRRPASLPRLAGEPAGENLRHISGLSGCRPRS